MSRRLKLALRAKVVKTCPDCGTALVKTTEPKFDPFWIALLIFLGALAAFYLIGIAIAAVGLWLLRKQTTRWRCPRCAAPALHVTD